MGIFGKSEEEKEKEREEKLKEEQRKTMKALQILGLDFDSYSDKEIKERNKKSFGSIGSTLSLEAAGELLSSVGMNNYQRISTGKFITIIQQNWILIRQNELIIRRLEKMLEVLSKKETKKTQI